MSDDRIIDFNDLKNKVKDSDVDKFEQYIYDLYFSVMDGSITMMEFSRKVFDYMRENNISQEKFMNIQKKFMERYGMDSDEIEKQIKSLGIDPLNPNLGNINLNSFNINNMNSESSSKSSQKEEPIEKDTDFYGKYGHKIKAINCVFTSITNETNDIEIIIDKEKVTLCSSKKINLMDAELNEFLLAYKNSLSKKIKVILCENYSEYDY